MFLQFSNRKKVLFYNFPTKKRRIFTIFQPKNGEFLQFSNNFDEQMEKVMHCMRMVLTAQKRKNRDYVLLKTEVRQHKNAKIVIMCC